MKFKSFIFILFITTAQQVTAKTYLSNGQIIEGPATHKTLSKTQKASLKVFWWNIAGQTFSHRPIHALGYSKQSTWAQLGAVKGNIKNYALKHRPDIIGLAEAKYSQKIYFQTLLPEYLFSAFVPYKKSSSRGILIFSLTPIHEIDSGELSIFPENDPNFNTIDRSDNYVFWERQNIQDRPFSIFSIQTKNEEFYLMPLHLVNPWPTYSIIYKKNSNIPGSGALTHYQVALKQMFLSEEKSYRPKNQQDKINVINPLHSQVKNLKNFLLNNLYHLEPIIIFGDFNSPSRIMPYGYPMLDQRLKNPDKGHRLLAHHFKVPFKKLNNTETIPTEHGGKGKPRVRIDKAFMSRYIKTNKISILKYSGSDHYPIEFIISK